MKEFIKYLRNQSLPGMCEMETDFQKGLPIPPIQKDYNKQEEIIDLIPIEDIKIPSISLMDAISNRKSQRMYADNSLTLEELSLLLWSTQGVKSFGRGGLVTLRTVPSGGSMHPFETYLLILNADSLKPGLYRYLAIEHKLLFVRETSKEFINSFIKICNNQKFIIKGNLVFIWTVRPYRTEYRYGEDSLKDILISVGHICQNLYLACEAINAGTCAIVAYQQEDIDKALLIDGEEELTLYLASVGKL